MKYETNGKMICNKTIGKNKTVINIYLDYHLHNHHHQYLQLFSSVVTFVGAVEEHLYPFKDKAVFQNV